MKRWFRPLAYSCIAVLALLAIFGGKAPADATLVEAVRPRSSARHTQAPATQQAALRERRHQHLSAELFATPAPTVSLPPPAQATAPVAPPVPEIKVLGWMQSETGPSVFVEFNGENYSLKPAESLDNAYRLDRVEAGFAYFTYVPTGDSRRYPVRDPALIE
ncbi:hypothetical protein [Lysobacter terrae]